MKQGEDLKGTNQELIKPYNRRIVLETIRRFGPITRGAIAARVGLTVQTVSNITRELEIYGFLSAVRDERKARGQPSRKLSVNPEGGHALGIELTPIDFRAVLVNLAGDVVMAESSPLDRPSLDQVLTTTTAMLGAFRKRRRGGRVLGVGLAMPGPFDVESMSFVGPTALKGWQGVPIKERIEAATGLAAFIETDHRAAAQGESLYGAGRAHRNFYYLHFGFGLGGCMILDGEPMRGHFGNAGEIGHMPLVPGGEACTCGNLGCLERYVSLEAFRRRREAVGVAGWIEEAAPVLRTAIAIIENVFDPETIVIGGCDGEVPMAALLARMSPLASTIAARADRAAPRILSSDAGKDAAMRGAAASAVAGMLSPRLGSGGASTVELDPMFSKGLAA